MATRRIGTDQTAAALSAEQFVRLRDLIEHRCGLYLDPSRHPSVAASVHARMRQLGVRTVDDYCHRVLTGADVNELRGLINLVTVTATCFLRDPSQFALLRRHILPTLLRRGAGQPLRIWSAGCSTGEEAYSIALTVWDMGLVHAHPDQRIEIVGTDVNSEALDIARRGVYAARALRNVSPDWLQKYFRPEGNRFRLNEDVRRMVRFEHGNLAQFPLATPDGAAQDVLFCKNVAIYFRHEMSRRLIGELHRTLVGGGFLLLGHSEALWPVMDGFEVVEREGAFCYRRIEACDGHVEPQRAKAAARHRTVHKRAPAPPAPQPSVPGLDESAARHAYEECLAAFRAEQWMRAEAALDALLQGRPSYIRAHLLLGGLYAGRGRFDEAIAQADRVLCLNDLEPRAHLLRGIVAARRGRAEEAISTLRRVVYLDQSLALAHFWLGNLYRDRGDVQRARAAYESVMRAWKRESLDIPEEFTVDVQAGQLVECCARSLASLQRNEDMAW